MSTNTEVNELITQAIERQRFVQRQREQELQKMIEETYTTVTIPKGERMRFTDVTEERPIYFTGAAAYGPEVIISGTGRAVAVPDEHMSVKAERFMAGSER